MSEYNSKRLGRPPASSVEVPTSSRIMQVAAKQFLEFGFEGVSMGQVAEACNVTKAVVYYYFSSKTDLFLKSMIYVMEISRQRAQDILNRDEPLYGRLLLLMRTRLRIDATLDLSAVMRGVQSVLTEEQMGEMRRAEQQLFDTIADAFRESIDGGHIRVVDPVLAARVFMSLLIIGKSEQERLGKGAIDIDSQAQELLDFLWVGM